MVTDSGLWTNMYIDNFAIVYLKMTSSGQKKCYFKFDDISATILVILMCYTTSKTCVLQNK